jgi:YHS domain-containing protein
MKTILHTLIALCAFILTVQAKDCPVTGKAGDREKVEYSKTIHFCCDKCKAKFDASPTAMVAKVASYKESDNKCPISGKAIDKTKSSEFKTTIGVCCNKCKAKVLADPDKYVEKSVK